MKKMFVYVYDQVNLGDDLFIEMLLKRYSNVKITFISQNPYQRFFCEYKNLKIINDQSKVIRFLSNMRSSFWPNYKHFLQKKSDAVVYIGGSIFMEYDNWKHIVEWWDFASENYKFYVLGANFGPYQTDDYKISMGIVFSRLRDICFRDQYSKEIFNDINSVRCAPDILYSYEMPQVQKRKNQIFVSLISCQDKELGGDFRRVTQDAYLNAMTKMIRGYLQLGYEIILASFCEAEGDYKSVCELSNRLNSKQIRILNYTGYNRRQFLQKMASSEYIISCRFHGVILGMAAGIPVYPIIYSDKTKNVLEDVGYAGNIGDLRDMENISFEESYVNLKKSYIPNVDPQVQDAQKHFEKLDQELI